MDALTTSGPTAAPALADPGERLAAAAVDAGLVALIALPFLLLNAKAAAIVAVGVAFLYLAGAVARFGQTLGHALFGAMPVIESTGQPATPLAGVIRAAVILAPAALAVAGPTLPAALLALVIFGPAALDDQVRGLHDRAAGTIVLRAERATAPPGVAAVACAAAIIIGIGVLAAASLEGRQDGDVAGFPGCRAVPSALVKRIEATLQGDGSKILLPRQVEASGRTYIVATGDIRRPGQPVRVFVRFTVQGQEIRAYDDDTASLASVAIDTAASTVPGRQALSTATACHLDATLRRARSSAP